MKIEDGRYVIDDDRKGKDYLSALYTTTMPYTKAFTPEDYAQVTDWATSQGLPTPSWDEVTGNVFIRAGENIYPIAGRLDGQIALDTQSGFRGSYLPNLKNKQASISYERDPIETIQKVKGQLQDLERSNAYAAKISKVPLTEKQRQRVMGEGSTLDQYWTVEDRPNLK